VFGFCVNQLGSRDEAEDAVQSTFLNAHRALQRGVTPEAELAWLFKIAHNVCLTRRRSSRRRGRVESPSDLDAVQDVLPAPARESADELIRLTDALSHMPDNQRRAILLREWQGLSYHEIADELQLSQSAVETLIFRARRTLAANLEVEPERPSALARVRRVLDIGSLLGAVKTLVAAGTAVQATAAAVAVSGAAVVATAPPVQHHFAPPAKRAAAPVVAKAIAPATTSVAPAASLDDRRADVPTVRVLKTKPAPSKAHAPAPAKEAAPATATTPPSVHASRTAPPAPPAATAPSPAAAPAATTPPATDHSGPKTSDGDKNKDKAKADTPAPARGSDQDKKDRGDRGDKKDKDKGHEAPKAEAPAAAPPQKAQPGDDKGDKGNKKGKGDKGGRGKDDAAGSPKYAPPAGPPVTPPVVTEQPTTDVAPAPAPVVSTDDDDNDHGRGDDKNRGKGKGNGKSDG
jgi:RNA polymerase sigma factor (sigma-70 family)